MDLQLLRTLVSVADQGSFSAAAALSMNCVQSNITLRIKRLEDHFGQPIFERGRGGARLTAFGHDGSFSPDDRGGDVTGANATEPLLIAMPPEL